MIMLIAVTGCKFFRKPDVTNVTAIKADTIAEQAVIPAEADPMPSPEANTPVAEVRRGTYYMIVGCFAVGANAESYASALRQKGYNPVIIPGRDNMQMVSVQSYNDYKASISEIAKYRNEVTVGAWVHFAR